MTDPSADVAALAIRLLAAQLRRITAMSVELDRLTTEVTEISDVVQSAIALITGLRDQLIAAGTDRAKLDQLATDLDTQANALAAAVAANTPAVPTP